MSSPKTGLRVAAFVFGVMCLGHLWRIWSGLEVRIGTLDMPMGLSIGAVVVSGGLSVWLWMLSSKS
jgi:hypothetical protein